MGQDLRLFDSCTANDYSCPGFWYNTDVLLSASVVMSTAVGLPANVNYADYFFAYVCKKQPLQLPLAQGERAQLPNGWVAGSKELFQK